eukprot:gene19154-biopygen6961
MVHVPVYLNTCHHARRASVVAPPSAEPRATDPLTVRPPVKWEGEQPDRIRGREPRWVTGTTMGPHPITASTDHVNFGRERHCSAGWTMSLRPRRASCENM